MYVRRRIRFKHLFVESWPLLLLVVAWSMLVVVLHQSLEYKWLAMPVLPVTLIGIAVSLYTGFRSVSAYNRWWEARQAIGAMATASRSWALSVQSLIYDSAGPASPKVAHELIYRHLGWVYAVAHLLRGRSRLKLSNRARIFGHRRVSHDLATMHESPDSYGRFLDPADYEAAKTVRNPAAFLLRRQAARVRELAGAGYLDSQRQWAMNDLLAGLDSAHGICDRIKNTPFPRQVANFGTIFTAIFAFLLPLSFLDVFEAEAAHQGLSAMLTHEFLYSLVPFAAVIAWVFLMMDRVGDSTEDPFEGGPHDVPLSTICRLIEIDLRQALGETDVPPPLTPQDDVLY